MPPLWIFLFFIFFGVALLACGLGFRYLESRRELQIGRIQKATAAAKDTPQVRVVIGPDPSQATKQNGLLRFRVFQAWQEYVATSGLTWRVEGILIATFVLAGVGALFGLRYHALVYTDVSSAAMAIVFASLPVLFVRFKRKARIREFEQQFPEALDFMARSVQSGHAFSVSLELLASESSDPLRAEFSRVFRELSLGADFEMAMTGLVKRVPLVDVRFFVSTVLLQRETGGNLAEMLCKLAFVMRERFQIKGQVRAASAHGRLTATVLGVMPFALALGLSVVSPDYLPSLVNDPFGRRLIITALLCQAMGYYLLRKVINIRV